MPTIHYPPLMRISIKLMRYSVSARSSPSTQHTTLTRHLHGVPFVGMNDFNIEALLPLSLSSVCMTRLCVCTSWYLSMWNVTIGERTRSRHLPLCVRTL